VADADAYIRTKTLASYEEHGFGMYLIERKSDREPVGLCGLVKRDTLPGPDIGFALLEDQWGQGYAHEAASAVVTYAFGTLRLPKLLAITLPANDRSSGLLEKLGFGREGTIVVSGDRLLLYGLQRPA
jgi:ribosomal-protein-alanine N-acetyltransferase